MSSTFRKCNVWLTPGCQHMLRTIDSGGAALTQNQLSAAFYQWWSTIDSGWCRVRGGPCTAQGITLGVCVPTRACLSNVIQHGAHSLVGSRSHLYILVTIALVCVCVCVYVRAHRESLVLHARRSGSGSVRVETRMIWSMQFCFLCIFCLLL